MEIELINKIISGEVTIREFPEIWLDDNFDIGLYNQKCKELNLNFKPCFQCCELHNTIKWIPITYRTQIESLCSDDCLIKYNKEEDIKIKAMDLIYKLKNLKDFSKEELIKIILEISKDNKLSLEKQIKDSNLF